MYPETIMHLCDIWAAHADLRPATICRWATGDGGMYTRLARGCTITVRRAARTLQWFSDHWPIDLAWPADIPRPEPASDSPHALALAEAQSTPAPSAAEVMQAVRAGRAALASVDLEAPGAFEQQHSATIAAASVLGKNGQIACPEALCLALGVRRHIYDAVIRQYADGRPRERATPRKESDAACVYQALRIAGDARFAERDAWEQGIVARVQDGRVA